MFGPYRLESLIGRGGMGEVHRAYDTRRHRDVALKRLPRALATDPAFLARFRRESELAARLNDVHIIPIHDFGEIDGTLFIDMRLVEGPTSRSSSSTVRSSRSVPSPSSVRSPRPSTPRTATGSCTGT